MVEVPSDAHVVLGVGKRKDKGKVGKKVHASYIHLNPCMSTT